MFPAHWVRIQMIVAAEAQIHVKFKAIKLDGQYYHAYHTLPFSGLLEVSNYAETTRTSVRSQTSEHRQISEIPCIHYNELTY
jgi:hypothetical protein